MRLLLLTLMLLFAGKLSAETWIVNNLPGSAADFSSLADAITAAQDGDTLFIQPSGIVYGAVTFNKQLYLLGAGHYPSFSNGVAATIAGITLGAGADGTFIKGLKLSGSITALGVVTDVVVSGCYISTLYCINSSAVGSTGWVVEGNVLINTTGGGYVISVNGNGINMIIRNNFMMNTGSYLIMSHIHASAVIEHNIIGSGATPATSLFANTSTGNTLRDNIFLSNASSPSNLSTNCSGCTWVNNLTYSPTSSIADLPGGNWNNTAPEFLSGEIPFSWNYGLDLQLEPGSPGHDSATDQGSIGLYGGAHNFSKEGYNVALPRIDSATLLNGTVPSGGTLYLNLQARVAGN